MLKINIIMLLGHILPFINTFTLDIHIFGDSHSSYGFCSNEAPKSENYTIMRFKKPLNFYIHYLGPRTMHRVGRDGKAFIDLKKFKVKDNSIIIYCFGEIDARCHVHNQVLKGRSQQEVIETLIQNYINSIKERSKEYKNITNVVCCIMPPADIHDSTIPIAGSLSDRIKYTQTINLTLNKKAQENGFYFLNYYEAYTDKNGLLNIFLSDGRTHVNVKKNFIIKAKLYDLLSKEFGI